MEFIRSEKIRPDYDPNTRHCLYGLDADLVSGFEHVLIFSVGKVPCMLVCPDSSEIRFVSLAQIITHNCFKIIIIIIIIIKVVMIINICMVDLGMQVFQTKPCCNKNLKLVVLL